MSAFVLKNDYEAKQKERMEHVKKRWKSKHLSVILSTYSLVILVILNVLTAVLMGIVASKIVARKSTDYMEQTQLGAQVQVEDFIERYAMLAATLANDSNLRTAITESKKDAPLSESEAYRGAGKAMQTAVESYSDILGMGVGSVAENEVYLPDGSTAGVAFNTRSYYKAANTGNIMLLQPYEDVSTGTMCVSIAAPVQKTNGQVGGVLCLDLRLDAFSEFLAELSFGETGRLMLLSRDNTVIGFENTSVMGQSFDSLGITDSGALKELDNPTGSLFTYHLNGEKKVGSIVPVEQLGWKILIGLSWEEYQHDTIFLIFLLGLMLTIDVVITAVLLKKLLANRLKPVADVKEALRRLKKGDLNFKIQRVHDDEIGEMADIMNECAETLSTYVQAIDFGMKALEQGDLTVESPIEFEGDFRPIQTSIESFIQRMRTLLADISCAADQVAAGSEQVSYGAQALAQGATEQSTSMESLTGTMEDISGRIEANASASQTANEQTICAGELLSRCGQQMEHLSQTMTNISNGSAKISNIIKTIEDIAFQTNILALNASVEAARAGAAGKGFAVVATEVGNLSSKSAEASKEIRQLIEDSLRSIQEGTKASRETRESLLSLIDQAKGVTESVNRISDASQGQADAMKQINTNLGDISSVIHTNSATAEQSAAASEELSSQAERLKQLIGQFKLPDGMTGMHLPQTESAVQSHADWQDGASDKY